MDAVKYLKELDRMCRAHQACDGCPILDCGKIGCGVSDSSPIELVDTVEIVEQWSKEHPVRTRQSLFLERYPNASTDGEGSLSICPALIEEGGCRKFGDGCFGCDNCRWKYWSKEVEDDD